MKMHNNYFGTVQRSTTVEVRADDTGGKYYLPYDNVLQGKVITGVAVVPQNGSDEHKSPSNRTILPDSVQFASFLTIESESVRQLDRMPVSLLQYDKTGANQYTPLDHLKGFDPEKSYIECPSAVMSGQTGKSFLLIFTYIDQPR